jgi:hypothetical protein
LFGTTIELEDGGVYDVACVAMRPEGVLFAIMLGMKWLQSADHWALVKAKVVLAVLSMHALLSTVSGNNTSFV